MDSKCWQVVFAPLNETNSRFSEFLEDFFAVCAVNYTSAGEEENVGYADFNDFDEQKMLAKATRLGIKLPQYKIIELKSDNWLKDYVIKFEAFEIKDFCIYGVHQDTPPLTDKIKLQIYAATAFGSNHQTTRACISAISDLYHQGFNPDKILDMGCGSGILSLCAAKLWSKSNIVSADIDEEAVVVTISNAANNNLSAQINAFASDGYSNSQIKQTAPYNLILSNILANPLMQFAPDLVDNLASGGYAVLSGFVDNQVDDVVQAHVARGLKLIKIYSIDNWRAALLKKE